jgi:hypothetical protein
MDLSRRVCLKVTALLSLTRAVWASERAENRETEMPEDNVLELRQYTLRRGQRDVLISLFEETLVDPQDVLGAHVLGMFRDLDDPDRFVWVRGFQDLATRQVALTAFYGGPVWLANRGAANATMVDSDNVLLLRPARMGSGIPHRAPNPAASGAVISATIYYLGRVDAADFGQVFDQAILPLLVAAGAQPIARLVTETSSNNFPRLPIRENDTAFIWFARWPDTAAEEEFVAKLSGLSGWRDSIPESVLPAFMRKPERLRLAPTTRSPLR